MKLKLIVLTALFPILAHAEGEVAPAASATPSATSESKTESKTEAKADTKTEDRAVALETKDDWKTFYTLCSTNWDRFENKLKDAREQVKKEINALSEKAYLTRYESEDPKINFLGAYWPADLSGKDKAWEFYKDCADLNWNARKAIGDLGTPKKEREKRIGELKDCLVARDTKTGPAEFPLDLMLACYEKQAGR